MPLVTNSHNISMEVKSSIHELKNGCCDSMGDILLQSLRGRSVSFSGGSFGKSTNGGKRLSVDNKCTLVPKSGRYFSYDFPATEFGFIMSNDDGESDYKTTIANQRPVLSSQRSIELEVIDNSEVDLFEDLNEDLSEKSVPLTHPLASCPRPSKLVEGFINIANENSTRSQPGANENSTKNLVSEIPGKKDVKSQREKNRQYAKDSRDRKNQKFKTLEETCILQECVIEIYKKSVKILYKRLKGVSPVWQSFRLDWYTGPPRQEQCKQVTCLLPVLDDDFIEELGNGVYGKIIKPSYSTTEKEKPTVCPEKNDKYISSSPEKHNVEAECDVPRPFLSPESQFEVNDISSQDAPSLHSSTNEISPGLSSSLDHLKYSNLLFPILVQAPVSASYETSKSPTITSQEQEDVRAGSLPADDLDADEPWNSLTPSLEIAATP